jgi:hypothetical protein
MYDSRDCAFVAIQAEGFWGMRGSTHAHRLEPVYKSLRRVQDKAKIGEKAEFTRSK